MIVYVDELKDGEKERGPRAIGTKTVKGIKVYCKLCNVASVDVS